MTPPTIVALLTILLAGASAFGQEDPFIFVAEPVEAPQADVPSHSPCGGPPSCCRPVCPCDCGPVWRISVDALFLDREDSNSAVLFRDTATNAVVFDADQLDFDAEVGPMVQIMRNFANGWAADVRYFGIDNWNEAVRRDVAPGQQFQENFNGLGFGDIDQFDVAYGSDLHSFEANLHFNRLSTVNLFAGYRMVELDELFHIDARNFVPQNPAIEISRTRTTNYLHGFQIGADALIFDAPRFRLEGVGRAGVFGNHVHQTMFVRDNGVNLPEQSLTEDGTAFVGDLVFTGVYRLTDRLSARGGFQMLWLTGVALAPEQTQVNNFRTGTFAVNDESDVFYYGGFAGLEMEL